MNADEKQKKMQEAREKLKERFGDVRTGGQGSQRRKFKSTHKTAMTDSKLEGVMKKFNTQPIPDIAEVNMFTKDNKVISFQRPQVHASFQTQTMIVSGNPQTRNLKDCVSEVLNQLGPKQKEALKGLGVNTGSNEEPKKEEPKAGLNFQEVSETKA